MRSRLAFRGRTANADGTTRALGIMMRGPCCRSGRRRRRETLYLGLFFEEAVHWVAVEVSALVGFVGGLLVESKAPVSVRLKRGRKGPAIGRGGGPSSFSSVGRFLGDWRVFAAATFGEKLLRFCMLYVVRGGEEGWIRCKKRKGQPVDGARRKPGYEQKRCDARRQETQGKWIPRLVLSCRKAQEQGSLGENVWGAIRTQAPPMIG
jgi:hypothetical protein